MALLLLSLLGLLIAWEGGQALVPPSELKQMSAAGSKYIDTEVENAINGVKQMKTLMDKTSKDHQAILHTLEETKRRKEEAVQLAREKEQQLAAKQEVCNETMLALWEECKPCLKHTCMRFYSRTCRSGSGLVGRQLEEFLNRSSPCRAGLSAESRNFSDDRMVCREIRRNSAGCLRMRDECEKCREILSVDCWQTDPARSQLREQLEDALRLAERFTRRYDDLLRAFQAEMLNTTSLLDQLNSQFGWVSRLANVTQGTDGFLQVTTVLSKAPNLEDPSAPPDTQVTVQLFDSEPLSLTVPGDISWEDPRFMEIVGRAGASALQAKYHRVAGCCSPSPPQPRCPKPPPLARPRAGGGLNAAATALPPRHRRCWGPTAGPRTNRK
ncbi:LOW QUALITY PROTEIN: clusterin [Harpia harpyja]|uniref:LOW QUALITY PROTEIN: clusterin n=1 Tax=Harpia harpyja TaxID=202280 RepID=UPI0022B18828|nr:LOW QUALITY PROTEIN: clusterin [Harpia harpyja]